MHSYLYKPPKYKRVCDVITRTLLLFVHIFVEIVR